MKKKIQTDYQCLFLEIAKDLETLQDAGSVATYIPELAEVDPNKMGIHLITTDNRHYFLGDSNEKFSIQSISKVFALTMAFRLEGEQLWNRVGVEPSGTAFNSLVQLEYERGIPRNPFINPGALVICDVLVSHFSCPKDELIHFIRQVSGNPLIDYNPNAAESERATGYRNCALIYLMKSFGNIKNDIDTVLDVYFHLCSIEMTCKELAQAFLFLASNGVNPLSSEVVVTASKAKRINAVMQLCGFYDEAGEFSFKVGLPGKSGVGGGIIAVHPGKYSIAVWSPKLNSKGNCFKGMRILESLTTLTESSIF